MFDKVFVISYINNFEKRSIITKKLNDLGISFEFMYGSNLYNIPTFRNLKQLGTDEHGTDYFIHAISCSLAHLNAVEYAYSSGANNVLIIEDDVMFHKDKNYILDCLNNYPKDADLIQYGWINFYGYNSKIAFNLNLYLEGAQMYALCNRNVMKDYIESQHKYYSSADNIYIFKNNNQYNFKYKIYTVYPQLAIDITWGQYKNIDDYIK